MCYIYVRYFEHEHMLVTLYRDGIEPSLYGFDSVRVLVKFVNARFYFGSGSRKCQVRLSYKLATNVFSATARLLLVIETT